MKKYIKPLIFILALLIVFGTYKLFSKKSGEIRYIALGDSIAAGVNSYGAIDYGYTDYIEDYLLRNDRLGFYTNSFAESGYTTRDVMNDINDNKVVEVDGKKVYLKEALRESDLVTLTIGANDFFKEISLDAVKDLVTDMEKTKKEADNIAIEVKNTIILIKKYAKNKIVVTGYYNPFPRLLMFKDNLDEVIKYFNYSLEEICEELGVYYVDIFDKFDGNKDVLPNPFNIHPNKKGYEIIANEIIKTIE